MEYFHDLYGPQRKYSASSVQMITSTSFSTSSIRCSECTLPWTIGTWIQRFCPGIVVFLRFEWGGVYSRTRTACVVSFWYLLLFELDTGLCSVFISQTWMELKHVCSVLFSSLQINMVKRHLDAGAVNEFWSYLDDFMLLKTPSLYQGVLGGNHAPPPKEKI